MPAEALTELQHWRQRLYDQGLIGVYPDGVGFGNISHRYSDGDQFIITGSTTGRFPKLGPEHFTLVARVDPEQNTLWCTGPIIASSESMSHYVVYRELPWVNGVIHLHHLGLWERLLHRVPTTKAGITYGTPEMATSIVDLIHTTNLPERKLFVMAGHREGIFAFGADLAEAGEVLIDQYRNL